MEANNPSNRAENNPIRKVLVIDDSKTIRRTAETVLTNAGYDVITAVDGFSALAEVVEHHPDIIFMDIMMPRLDGYQTCALIKNNEKFRNTPIVMLSRLPSFRKKGSRPILLQPIRHILKNAGFRKSARIFRRTISTWKMTMMIFAGSG